MRRPADKGVNMDDTIASSRDHPRARTLARTLAWIKSAILVSAASTMALLGGGQDPAGQAFLYGGFVLAGTYWLAFVLPALLLLRGATGWRVGLAFALLILPDLISALAVATL